MKRYHRLQFARTHGSTQKRGSGVTVASIYVHVNVKITASLLRRPVRRQWAIFPMP